MQHYRVYDKIRVLHLNKRFLYCNKLMCMVYLQEQIRRQRHHQLKINWLNNCITTNMTEI